MNRLTGTNSCIGLPKLEDFSQRQRQRVAEPKRRRTRISDGLRKVAAPQLQPAKPPREKRASGLVAMATNTLKKRPAGVISLRVFLYSSRCTYRSDVKVTNDVAHRFLNAKNNKKKEAIVGSFRQGQLKVRGGFE